jgi:hypothetical protein
MTHWPLPIADAHRIDVRFIGLWHETKVRVTRTRLALIT